ncbi:hypothetical protein DFP72DRAFT_162906 [Ephemerocybe angulata]|uniref:Uncharacterized protein n=1 Tax=Ephemerocybe angulata TaxID=980116 RepID=A0A8H6I4Z4_9AGAR|nr:hypothetical protein DFP72DRAFT_162906 [Tulosesus angulatus]
MLPMLHHHSPAPSTHEHTSSHPASSTSVIDPRPPEAQKWIFVTHPHGDICTARSGSCPSPSTDHSTPFSGRPNIKITPFEAALSLSLPLHWHQRASEPLSHGIISAEHQALSNNFLRRQTRHTLESRGELDPFPGPPKIEKIIPAVHYSPLGIVTSPQSREKETEYVGLGLMLKLGTLLP